MRKYLYIGLTGTLTLTTLSACYWQTKKYYISTERWSIIASQLSNSTPSRIQTLHQSDLYAYKYVQIQGTLAKQFIKVYRTRQGRLGHLFLQPLIYLRDGKQHSIVACVGWCPETVKDQLITSKSSIFKGILKKKESSDVNSKIRKSDLDRSKIVTYINLKEAVKKLGLEEDQINSQYYFEILKPIEGNDNTYPYQYSVDNFQLPYLTPDKHRAYAIFWGCTSLVGIWAIFKVFRLK